MEFGIEDRNRQGSTAVPKEGSCVIRDIKADAQYLQSCAASQIISIEFSFSTISNICSIHAISADNHFNVSVYSEKNAKLFF